jgi:hypothetical protein
MATCSGRSFKRKGEKKGALTLHAEGAKSSSEVSFKCGSHQSTGASKERRQRFKGKTLKGGVEVYERMISVDLSTGAIGGRRPKGRS